MHGMKLRVQVLRPSLAARVQPCHWSEGRHNYVGVSLQERLATMQVFYLARTLLRWMDCNCLQDDMKQHKIRPE